MKRLILLNLLVLTGSLVAQTIDGPISAINENNAEMQETEFVASFPPGAVATFPKPFIEVKKDVLPAVYLKSVATEKVWIGQPIKMDDPFETLEGGRKVYLGFTVPQLNAGVYEVWYENIEGAQVDFLKINISPKLIAREGITTDNPNENVQVQIGIDSTIVLEKGSTEPKEVKIPIKITSSNKEIADVVEGDIANTDKDGFATWKIAVKAEGVARFTAAAEGFEPVEIFVVGKPKESAKIELAEENFQSAKIELASFEDKAALAKENVNGEELKVLESRGVRDAAVSRKSRLIYENSEKAVERASLNAAAFRGRLETLMAAETMFFSAKNLLPGDVLQMQGVGEISNQIRRFESAQLYIDAVYSHSALYLGTIGGRPMVAEMLAGGYTLNTLDKSIAGATLVDVYRWKNIDLAKANLIAQKGLNFCGSPNPKNGCVWYAYGQIDVMTLAALGFPGAVIRVKAAASDVLTIGRRQMICSEFVAWAYEDSGLSPQADKWWDKLESSGVLSSADRRKDYTTPNMLVNSKFQRIARLKGVNN